MSFWKLLDSQNEKNDVIRVVKSMDNSIIFYFIVIMLLIIIVLQLVYNFYIVIILTNKIMDVIGICAGL